jgi:hypothetical protein
MKSVYRVFEPISNAHQWEVRDTRTDTLLKQFPTRREARAFKVELDGRVAAARKAEQPQHGEIAARR